MSENEPKPADAGAEPIAPKGDDGKEPEKGQAPDKSGEGDAKKEEISKVGDEQLQKLVEGWKEDREYMQSEIKRLRSEVKNPEYTRQEEEELEELSGVERDKKVVEIHKKRDKALEDAELKAVKSEVRFYERTSKEFSDNKKEILKVAQDYDSPNLKQAILIWRGLNADKVKKELDLNDQRKKEADGKSGGTAGGTVVSKPYDPKSDGKKSFGDIYREGGV